MGTNSQIDPPKEAVIFFDGVCNLCNGAVQFVINRDKNAYFKFASLQSKKASQILQQHGFNSSDLESIILLEAGELSMRSSAVLSISKRLSGLWPLFYIFKIVPRSIRDLAYDWIARNRYQWFGKRDECMIPTRELNSRFIEAQ